MTFNYQYNDFGNIKNILYVGDDSNYWAQIKKEFDKNFGHISCLFYIYRVEGNISYKDVFLKILQLKPTVVYLDFTKRHNDMFSLSRLLCRDGNFYGSSIVGLVNHVEEVEETMKNGCDFVYVKCGELYDSVYGPLRYSIPDRIRPPNFAKGTLDENRDLYAPVRIGYIHPQKIHFESNFLPQENKDYEVETFIPRNNLPSKVLKNMSFEELSGNYYNHCETFSMEYNYVNKPTLLKQIEKAQRLKQKIDASPQLINATIQEYDKEQKFIRKNFSSWVQSLLGNSKEKLVRILVIDDKYEILNQYDGDLSQTKYAFRMQSEIDYALLDFESFRPDLICLNLINEPSIDQARKIIYEHKKKKGTLNKLHNKSVYSDNDQDPLDDDDLDIEIDEHVEEDLLEKELVEKIINDSLKRLFKHISSVNNYCPNVMIFNCAKLSEQISEAYNYKNVISTKNKFDVNVLMKMANLVEKNLKKIHLKEIELKLNRLMKENPKKYGKLTPEQVKEPKFFVDKLDKLSGGRIKFKVNIVAISESEIWFKSTESINFGVYEMDIPTKVRITIAPDNETFQNFTADKDGDIYHGLIHSFDENGKKLLRQEVNRIFFSDLIVQRELESKEYQDLTKDALNKKLDELENLRKMMDLNEVKKKI